jgi:hypothetical protein
VRRGIPGGLGRLDVGVGCGVVITVMLRMDRPDIEGILIGSSFTSRNAHSNGRRWSENYTADGAGYENDNAILHVNQKRM